MIPTGAQATAAVYTRLKNLLGAQANVWNTMESPTDPAAYEERFANGAKIHAYEVTREGSEPDETHSVNALRRNERVVIYGYLGYQLGISEPLFQAEVDQICGAFDPEAGRDFAVEAPDSDIDWSRAPLVEGPRIARLGQVLVHYVKITVVVEFFPIF